MIKQGRKLRVSLERANGTLLLQTSDIGLPNRTGRVHPQRLPT